MSTLHSPPQRPKLRPCPHPAPLPPHSLQYGSLNDYYAYLEWEQMAVERGDSELLLVLQSKTRYELSHSALAFLIR